MVFAILGIIFADSKSTFLRSIVPVFFFFLLYHRIFWPVSLFNTKERFFEFTSLLSLFDFCEFTTHFWVAFTFDYLDRSSELTTFIRAIVIPVKR